MITDMNNFLRRKKAERDRNFFGKKKPIVEGKFKKIILENTSLAVTGALAHRLQHGTAQHGQRGLERDLTIGYLALQTTFAK